ncbi:MAG TPA: GNAT family N-acetyltransferase [Acidimicrobiales bacterium]|nr:GNAT family N-acetyltransferase [Acidimicrobiales bacterium]
MYVRPFADSDLRILIDLTVETFRPFYEGYVRALLGEEIFQHQHGEWEREYHDELPTLLDPTAGRFIAVGVIDDAVEDLVSWKFGGRPHHGEIYLLAVASTHRDRRLGRVLCEYAIQHMKAAGVGVVGIGTGDDAFHYAARMLYEDLGFTKIPVAAYLKRI